MKSGPFLKGATATPRRRSARMRPAATRVLPVLPARPAITMRGRANETTSSPSAHVQESRRALLGALPAAVAFVGVDREIATRVRIGQAAHAPGRAVHPATLAAEAVAAREAAARFPQDRRGILLQL